MTDKNALPTIYFSLFMTALAAGASVLLFAALKEQVNSGVFNIVYALTATVFVYWVFNRFSKKYRVRQSALNTPFPKEWKTFLQTHVAFYAQLDSEKKKQFEKDVKLFLAQVKINGVEVAVTIEDQLLVASSAVIPVFAFPNWEYHTLDEVLLYPNSFNTKYEVGQWDSMISGMVGSGVMEGKMILSKPALHNGFKNTTDKKNVGIHEFVHLIDKEDGQIDSFPSVLANNAYALPWLDLIHEKSLKIRQGNSDINPYGATDKTEFFAVAAEYFFEQPDLLEQKHPKLYKSLSLFFKQDIKKHLQRTFRSTKPQRNQPCPCGSGKKHKKCCGK